ncbi:MAG: UDP-N-acetylmuramoyl-L-alanyl-D-glutamate--2,6-diaminopimelate ligase, partial [Firmicutes bacterium]|nr:UDP-N-acetylmuramoyl-L-alanyl-D-glutamate--2,6-diaminopimelate ligase [Bacillota bacterium]
MRILQLVENIKCEVLGSDTIITGLSCDSRLVNEGEVFFAISGLKFDGHDYVEEAVKNGAVAVVVEKTQNVAPNITQIVVENTRVAMGEMAAAYYQYPS